MHMHAVSKVLGERVPVVLTVEVMLSCFNGYGWAELELFRYLPGTPFDGLVVVNSNDKCVGDIALIVEEVLVDLADSSTFTVFLESINLANAVQLFPDTLTDAGDPTRETLYAGLRAFIRSGWQLTTEVHWQPNPRDEETTSIEDFIGETDFS